MWGNTLIIDRLIPPVSPDDLQGKEEDKLVLAWEQRRWMRGRFTTAKGRKIGVALPTGTTLAPDAILWVGPDWYLKSRPPPNRCLKFSRPDTTKP
jgi:urease accessory protein UreE